VTFEERIKKTYGLSNMILPITFVATMMFPALYWIIENPVDLWQDDNWWFLLIAFSSIFFGIAIPVLFWQHQGRQILRYMDSNPEAARTILEKRIKRWSKSKLIDKSVRMQNEIEQKHLLELFDSSLKYNRKG